MTATYLLLTTVVFSMALKACAARKLAVAGPINTFGLKLLSHSPPGENVMISPYSICTAVAMLNAGAAGTTKAQIDKAFGWGDIDRLSGQYRKLLSSVGSSGEFNLSSSNRLYVDKEFHPLQSYTNTLSGDFGADLERVDFSSGDNSDTVQQVNSWVESQTNGKIDKMFKEIDPQTRAILINTIYFNAQWQIPFTKTVKRAFYTDESHHTMVDTMTVSAVFGYYRSEDVEVVKLPYLAGKSDISMIIIKPAARGGLAALEKKIIKKRFSKINKWIKKVNEVYSYTIALSMPKFEFGSKFDNLKEILKENFGVKDVFNVGKADLSGIDGSRNLFVSSVIHQSFISVDEKRTEAAAATSVQVRFRSGPRRVNIDHPFMFLIYDQKNKVVLFLGRMYTPGNAE
ncbi:leukocyte elastase inhibitor-like [Bolinopsis microptera]|uniref:leukocyte elastase inhibitor-like n=1 Tax=Bolinopsis microptera TaxID=2820187 RepID=UPI003079C6AA